MQFLRNFLDIYNVMFVAIDLCSNFYKYKSEQNKIQRNECDISGKCVVVTGGSRGIGKSCAREFAQRGAIVVIGSSNVKIGERAAEEIRRDTGNPDVVNDFCLCWIHRSMSL